MATTILLIEPDPAVRHTVEVMLTAINCAVVPVSDWVTAVDASTAITFDALIALDVLCSVDREQFIASVKGTQPGIVVIAAETDPRALTLARPDLRIRKPVALEELRQALSIVNSRREVLRAMNSYATDLQLIPPTTRQIAQ
jgi:DNA-binding response OmpR family regulator